MTDRAELIALLRDARYYAAAFSKRDAVALCRRIDEILAEDAVANRPKVFSLPQPGDPIGKATKIER